MTQKKFNFKKQEWFQPGFISATEKELEQTKHWLRDPFHHPALTMVSPSLPKIVSPSSLISKPADYDDNILLNKSLINSPALSLFCFLIMVTKVQNCKVPVLGIKKHTNDYI